MKAWIPLLVLVGVASCSGAVHQLSVPFADLNVGGGKVLKAGVVKSYDDLKSTVVLAAGREIMTLPIARLPAELAAAVREQVPERTAEEKAEERREAQRLASQQQKREAAKQKAAEREAAEVRRNTRSDARQTASRVEEQRLRLPELVLRAAEIRARNAFGHHRYEIYEPEQVPGWENRWRVPGRVFEHKTKGSNVAKDREFEVVLETKDGRAPRVLDLRVDM